MATIRMSNVNANTTNVVDQEIEEDALYAFFLVYAYSKSIHTREPIRDSALTGSERVREILSGHVDRCYEQYKMEQHVFFNLVDLMRERRWIEDSRYIKIEEKIAMFLSIVGHNNRFRDVAEDFQHSPETIGRHFKSTLLGFIKLAEENIKPPQFDRTAKEVANNPKWFPFFKDCVGAIDGTHIHATVPVAQQITYRNRKGDTTQNVMCTCSHDMQFTFVFTGWEGSANDCRVFNTARSNPEFGFPHPPPGKYYVVDSGYASQTGYLTPFKGERYPLQDYRGRSRQPRTAKELFNHRHSSIRNVIERSFGVLKKRFPILSKMPCFPLNTQGLIVIACCAIHNYIRQEDAADQAFAPYNQPDYVEGLANVDEVGNTQNEGASSSNQAQRAREMELLRKTIANELAIKHGFPPI